MTRPRAYRSYKSSGTQWLGDLPSHWAVEQLRYGYELVRRPPRIEDGNVTAYRDGEVTLRSNRRIDGYTEADKEIGYQGVRKGDLVIHAMDAFAGAVGVSDSDGKSTPVYSVCQPLSGHEPRYAARVLRHIALSGYITSLGKGVRERSTEFRWSDAKNVLLPAPPLDEQRQIAEYLDRETGKIDELITKQEQLVATLTERRQAVIAQAVTRGLDPTIKLREIGVYWLRQIPTHWTVRKFSQAASINGGQVDPRDEPYASMTLIAPNHIEKVTGRLLDTATAGDQGADSGKYLAREGQVIYSKIRPGLRKAVLAPFDCLCSADMYAISGDKNLLRNPFLQLLLLSEPFSKFVVDVSARVAMPKVNRESLAGAVLWFPSLEEQDAIIDHISSSVAKIDLIVAKAKQMIGTLRERRAALISAAVTGKIDVRGL